MAYHLRKIKKGRLGDFTKIREEFEELEDAMEQGNLIMAILECTDMIGAIEAFLASFNLTLDEAIIMKNATESAFIDGSRL